MASKKGQGNKKGKQLARKCMTPQLYPPQTSSDEEAWPIWQQLQEKITTLEAKRATSQALPVSAPQRRRSARESRSHGKAKLKDLAEDLLS